MKKTLTILGIALLLCCMALPALAKTSVEVNYYKNDFHCTLTDYTNNYTFDPTVDQDGTGVALEWAFKRFSLSAEYTKLKSDKSAEDENGSFLYASNDNILDLKFGYQVLERKKFKFNASLVYNQSDTDSSGGNEEDYNYSIKIRSLAAELKTTFIISNQLTTELEYTGSLTSSTPDEQGLNFSGVNYYSLGGKLNYMINDQFTVCLGYKQINYTYDFTYADTSNKFKELFEGMYAGVKYTF